MAGALDLVIVELVMLSIVCFFLIRYYKGNMVTIDVAITVYVSWVMGGIGILLLPYDLSVALVDKYENMTLLTVWRILYWSTLFLAWILLPIQMDFHGSGHFTFREKLVESILKLICSGILAMIAGIIYLIYMFASGGGSFNKIISFTMAMSNTYGVIVITVLMGVGLVGIPKRLWMMADTESEMKRLYISANVVEELYQEARYELEDIECEIEKVIEYINNNSDSGLPADILKYVNILKENVSNFTFASRAKTHIKFGNKSNSPSANEDNFIKTSKKDLVALNARLIKTQLKSRASEQKWRVLLNQARKAIICQSGDDFEGANLENKWCKMNTEVNVGRKSLLSTITSALRCNQIDVVSDFWNKKCRFYVLRLFSLLFAIASCLILWSEMLIASNLNSPISYLMGAYNNNPNSVIIQAISFLFLGYMSLCTYWSIFRINISWAYQLQGPQLSPPSSLLFNGEYLSRLQFALGYNFLLILNVKNTDLTAFRDLMQKMDTIPVFGSSFTVYIPAIMTLVALITLFDGFTRIMLLFGIESEHSPAPCKCFRNNIPTPEEEEKLRVGQSLIMNELKKNALKKEDDNSTHNDIISPMINQAPIAINNLTITNRNPSSYLTISSSKEVHDDDDLDDDDDDIVDIELNCSPDQSNNKYSSNQSQNSNNNKWTKSLYGMVGKLPYENRDNNNKNSNDSDYNPLRGNNDNKHNFKRSDQTNDIFAISNEDSENLYGGRYND